MWLSDERSSPLPPLSPGAGDNGETMSKQLLHIYRTSCAKIVIIIIIINIIIIIIDD